MLAAELVLRIIAGLVEISVEETKKATPEQVQAIIDRREKWLNRFGPILDKVFPQ